jgi:hypothetical protein
MKGVGVMGVFLGQLPPAELARLKAELAETLIAYFCYPRFFDYRSETLRTRPVDRSKRQEVWLYLSSVDFTAWNRIDLLSPDFQYQVERLFIHFVQRNRSFFGEQGRKRMGDVRMLIGSSATTVVQGLREHLAGHSQSNQTFGSPRRVVSWSAPSTSGHPELTWEQIGQQTLILQQQIQEARGESKQAGVQNEGNPLPTRRSSRVQSQALTQPPASNGAKGALSSIEQQPTGVQVSVSSVPTRVVGRNSAPLRSVRGATTLQNGKSAGTPSAPVAPTVAPQLETPVPPVEATATVPVMTPGRPVPPAPLTSPAASPVAPALPFLAKSVRESSSVLNSDADVAIFEQLRLQLMIWLRVQAVKSGVDIANQSPLQLLEQLRQQDNCEETRLQIVSTLLNLVNQVSKNGHASLYDYKQALMLHMIHTRT